MSTSQTPEAGAFDPFIDAGSATLTPPLEATPGDPQEVKAKKGKKPSKPPMGKKQKMMLMGGLVIAALAAFLLMGDETPPQRPAGSQPGAATGSPQGGSPDGAIPLPGATPSGGSPSGGSDRLAGIPDRSVGDPSVGDTPFAGFQEVTPMPGQGLSGDPALDALNALSAAPNPVIENPADRVPVAPLPAAPTPPSPAAPSVMSIATAPSAPPDLDQTTRLRIRALENDLKRAQDARRAAERNQRTPVTVVAVLEDGVVVRDARGREKVVAVGEQVML